MPSRAVQSRRVESRRILSRPAALRTVVAAVPPQAPVPASSPSHLYTWRAHKTPQSFIAIGDTRDRQTNSH